MLDRSSHVWFAGNSGIHGNEKLWKWSWLLRLTAFTVSAYYLLISAVTEAAQRCSVISSLFCNSRPLCSCFK